MCISTRKDWVQ
jgi:hypothetical protein